MKQITAIAVNPGNLVDSRALTTNTPQSLSRMQRFVYKPLLPLLRLLMGPTLRTSAPAGVDIADISVNHKYDGERGFFTLTQKDQSSPESQDEFTQTRLWGATLSWANITKDNTALQGGFK